MTGFSRVEGRSGPFEWTWELRSVNGKGLDVRTRVPSGFEALENDIRKSAAKAFSRGNIQVALQFDQRGTTSELRVNQEVLGQVLRELEALRGTPGTVEATLDGILGLRGVLELTQAEVVPSEIEERDAALSHTLEIALNELDASRRREGEHIDAALRGHLSSISQLVQMAEVAAARRVDAARERLLAAVDELLEDREGLPEERLAQEVALLLVKGDVSEEVQRLQAHVAAGLEALASDKPVGRRLDFLCQEFNREANTLCSKAGETALTSIGLDLKVEIERFREQVQNVE